MDDSLTEPPFIPAWAKNFKEPIFFIYNGSSMRPLFKPGDLLCARRPILDDIHPGDIVIVFRGGKPNRFDHIVHRVVSVKRDYLTTKGDNNLNPDEEVVTSENLVGLVTCFGRQNHVYSVKGGILGLFYGRLILIRNLIWQLIKRLGWQVYSWIRKSGLIARAWQPMITKIYFTTGRGPLMKYCHGKRTVAHWWPELNYFNVVKPFDLVIPHPEKLK
jgi:signal peptidase I